MITMMSDVSHRLQHVPFLAVAHALFFLLLAFRVVALALRTRLLVRSRMLGDLRLLWQEYWRWRYVPDHLAGLSLGISTLLAYVCLLVLTVGRQGPQLHHVWARHPWAVAALMTTFLGVSAYTVYETVLQHRRMIELVDALQKLRAFRFAKGTVSTLQSLDWMREGPGAWVHLGLSAFSWVSDEVVNRVVDRQIRKALAPLLLHLGIDFGLRAALLGGVLYLGA